MGEAARGDGGNRQWLRATSPPGTYPFDTLPSIVANSFTQAAIRAINGQHWFSREIDVGYEAGVAYLFWMSVAVAAFLIIGFIYACIPVRPEDRIGVKSEEPAPQRKRRRVRRDQPAIR